MHDLLTMLGHDLRSPLGTIIDLTSLIEDELDDPERVRSYLHLIDEQSSYMLQLVNGLVAAAKADAGLLTPESRPFSPWELAQAVVGGFVPGKGRPSISLEATTPLPHQILGDELCLRQILTNLVANAVRHTREGGIRLRLHHQPADSTMSFLIADTGSGMDAVALARAQHHDSGAFPRSSAGHGLGLWIVRRLVALLQGQLTIVSAPGQGTAAKLVLPIPPLADSRLVPIDQLASHLPPQHVPVGQLAGLRVLVADDMPVNRLLAATLLKQRGAGVDLAEDGLAAQHLGQQALAQGRAYDLIILDLNMPGLEGGPLALALRQAGHRGPIIGWTADLSARDQWRHSFTAWLDKPMVPGQLDLVLSQVLTPAP